MTSGPLAAALCLCKSECVEHWRSLMGNAQDVLEARGSAPASLLALFGEEILPTSAGPTYDLSSVRGLISFFPGMVPEPMLENKEVRSYLNEAVVPTLVPAMTQLCSDKPEDPVLWLADWLTLNNPYNPAPMDPGTGPSTAQSMTLPPTP